MYRIIDERGSKKTYRLMLDAKHNGASTIICANPSAMKEKAYHYGIVGLDFMSYEQFVNRYNPKKLVIIILMNQKTLYDTQLILLALKVVLKDSQLRQRIKNEI